MNEQFITTSPRYGFVNVFTKLTEGQSEYQKQYLILANYMTAIRKMVLDTSDLPKKYHDDAQSCFDEIQKVVSRYSYSIGNQLKDIPENMLTSLTEITECFNEAIPAATRLSNQQGIDGDILAVKKAIRKSLNFVDNSIDDCITIIDNINKFCNGGGIDGTSLDDIATNAEQLVQIMAAGCKDYNQHIAYLQSLIDQLNGQVKSVTAAEIGVGIGVGVFLAIGGVAIGLMVSGGAGTPIVLAALGVMGVAVGAGLTAFGFGTSEIRKLQAEIAECGNQIDKDTAAIDQLNYLSQIFTKMKDSLGEVKNALFAIQQSWGDLFAKLSAMLVDIVQAKDDAAAEFWDRVATELEHISHVFEDDIITRIKAMYVSNLVVSLGNYNFSMSDEEWQKEYENAKKIDFVDFLRSA